MKKEYVGWHLTNIYGICKIVIMFIPRLIIPKLEKELSTKQIVVLTGLRQVGKTTILNYLFDKVESKNKVFLDLGNPLHRKIFEEEDFERIWQNLQPFGLNKQKKAYLFLDEIQNLPPISQAIKYLYDHWQAKCFLTGSSSFYLKNLFSESLAGRKLIFELFPLTFTEFLLFKGIEKISVEDFAQKSKNKNSVTYEKEIGYYKEFMEYGGFPAVVLEPDYQRKKQILEEIFKSYFEIDVKGLADFKEVTKLRDLILLLVSRIASKTEIGKLASELVVSRETIYNYLSFLEQTYFISLLPKFSHSYDRQAAGGKKLFFSDIGLANFLGRCSAGQLLENSVFQNLRPFYRLAYYSHNTSEVDFILDEKTALEVKTTSSLAYLRSLKQKKETLKLKEAYLVCQTYSDRPEVIMVNDL